ncbi:ATP-dependent zinc metalloprotease FtsH [Caminibacter pacificus]|uniref:ATP-dependent zinc metalloprotease FtsH n=1 Tax=Caminibacter pacificus TaxID=1424653 RepID=A0AAJ4UXD3_9BACT|nr:ATP-dependent zinc metalloprotease FtsH [Caminibacter pacificus]NPA88451.1 ATP-dependent zinc metalloprotease FtsH [Campylobacterota bacterium]QCI27519.1 ATP-dependent zinc metalloprotease FtsH [Caminibacter pacificus]ROR38958.1 cell division protease FtsH [Caminibacter pacificus]
MDNKNNKNNNFFNQNPLLLFIIFAIVIIVIFRSISPTATNTVFNNQTKQVMTYTYSDIKQLAKEGKLEYVAIGKNIVRAKLKDGEIITVQKVPNDPTLVETLDKYKVPYGAINDNNWLSDLIFGWIIPIFIFFAIWMFLASRMQKGMGGVLGFGSAKGLIKSEKPNVKFDDVAGNEEAKEEVKEIVDFLKNPDRYIELGAKIPKGVLLVGPPGTGKTLLAKAVAGEADVPFFAVSGSSFIEMFVGVGAARVRDLFNQAKKEAPSIIFIDEIDAIGKSRAAGGPMGGNDEREQTLNQLLAEMDGFDSNEPVIVLAATNRPEVLDPALLRPGRFDRQVLVDKPDFKGRVEILKVHVKKIKAGKDVDLEEIARMTAGLAGADLANIVNEAALLAGRKNKKEVNQEDFVEAVERQIAGLEKRSRRLNDKDKKIVAYHESGHAVIAEVTPEARKVKKVSIVPRGLAALGYTLNMPEEDKYLMQKRELIAEVDTLLGGRAAEEVFIGEISTGAGNDLERATDIVRAMVSMYGMTDVAGLMVLEKQTNRFLGGFAQQREYSEKTQEEVDKFIKEFLAQRYEHVKETLKKYAPVIEAMVKELYEKEVIEGSRVRELIKAFEEGRLEEETNSKKSEEKDEKNSENSETDSQKEENNEKDGNNS